MIEQRFVYTEERDITYNAYRDKWVERSTTYTIEDKKKEIPTMRFLTEEDMMTVYKLLESKHMIFIMM